METNEKVPVGTVVKIIHQQGEYKVKGYNKDGSYLLYGGISGHGSFRDSFDIRPIKEKKSRKALHD
jgi:hypothetical protein